MTAVNEDFMQLFSHSFVPLLQKLKLDNSALFQEQLHLVENGQSFLTRITSDKTNFSIGSISPEDIDFLINNGFNFSKSLNKDMYYPHPSRESLFSSWKISQSMTSPSMENRYSDDVSYSYDDIKFHAYNKDNTPDVTKLCDYLFYFGSFQAQSLVKITHHLLKTDYAFMQALPQNGFHILHRAFKKRNFALVELLYQYGFKSYIADNDGKSLLSYAKEQSESMAFYTSMETKYPSGEASSPDLSLLYHTNIEILKKEAKDIIKNSEFKTKEFISHIEKQIANHPLAQQEEIIATSMLSLDPALLKKTITAAKFNYKTYQPQHYPLWKNLGDAGHHNLFHQFFTGINPVPLDTYLPHPRDQKPNDAYFLSHVATYLEKNRVKDYYSSGMNSLKNKNGADNLRAAKIQTTVLNHLNLDFLLKTNPHDGLHNSWFTTICNDKTLFSKFSSYLTQLSVLSPNTVLMDNKEEQPNVYYQTLVQKTWFDKNEQGITNLETVAKIYPIVFFHSIEMFSLKTISNTSPFSLTMEQENLLLNTLLTNMANVSFKNNLHLFEVVNTLINNLAHNSNYSWNQLQLDKNAETNLLDMNKDIFEKLTKLKLTEALQDGLTYKDNSKKHKI